MDLAPTQDLNELVPANHLIAILIYGMSNAAPWVVKMYDALLLTS
jgi:hypothetical protein